MSRGRVTSTTRLGMTLAVAALAAVAAPGALAQEPGAPDGCPGRPPANPADVRSIDAVLGALYASISGPAGAPREWDRLRSLFLCTAQLVPVAGDPPRPRRLDVEEYIEGAKRFFRQSGFFEREASRRVHRYGPVAQVFSTYETRRSADDPEPFARGINSIQLVHDGSRWWVVSISWADTGTAGPIPDEFR